MNRFFEIVSLFTDREIALIFWSIIFLLITLFSQKVRLSLWRVVKLTFSTTILQYLFIFMSWEFIAIYFFHKFGLWDFDLIKDSVIWFLFSCFPIGIDLYNKYSERHYWSKLLLDSFKFMVVVQFITSSYPFSLTVEMILIPFIGVVSASNALSRLNKEYYRVTKFTDSILVLSGSLFIIWSLMKLFLVPKEFWSLTTLQSFLLPVILTLTALPVLYLYLTHMKYELLLLRLNHNKIDEKSKKRVVCKIYKFCMLSVARLDYLLVKRNIDMINLETLEDFHAIITDYKHFKNTHNTK